MRVAELEQQTHEINEVFNQAQLIKRHIEKRNASLSSEMQRDVAYAITLNAREHRIDPNLVAAIADVESGFDLYARGSMGERGPVQVRERTFHEHGEGDFDDWRDNLRAGVRYLRYLIDRFGKEEMALAAYNAGPSGSRERIWRISGRYARRVSRRRDVLGGEAKDR